MTLTFNDNQLIALCNALHLAANEYRRRADQCRAADSQTAAAMYDRQAAAALQQADRFDQAGYADELPEPTGHTDPDRERFGSDY